MRSSDWGRRADEVQVEGGVYLGKGFRTEGEVSLRWYLWCHIIAGWVLTTLWVGGLMGLLKT